MGLKSIFSRNNKQTSTGSTPNQSFQERMKSKSDNIRSSIELGASKDMLAVAKKSDANNPGAALNACKSAKGEKGAGNFKYKTDLLTKMLNGLVGKYGPGVAENGKKSQRSLIMQSILMAGEQGSFEHGIEQAMMNFQQNVQIYARKNKQTQAWQNEQLKVINEVLHALAARMSTSDTKDPYGLNLLRPRQDERSSDAARARDLANIDRNEQSRVYHRKFANAIKNIGSALKESGRKTGAAINTYTEPARRPVTLAGYETSRGAARAAEPIVDNADHAYRHVSGTAKGVNQTVKQTAKDFRDNLRNLAQNSSEDFVTARRIGGEKRRNEVEKSRKSQKRVQKELNAAEAITSAATSSRSSSERSSSSTRVPTDESRKPSLSRASSSSSSISTQSRVPERAGGSSRTSRRNSEDDKNQK